MSYPNSPGNQPPYGNRPHTGPQYESAPQYGSPQQYGSSQQPYDSRAAAPGRPLPQPAPNSAQPMPRRAIQPRRRRSLAWIYYSVLAVLIVIFTISKHQPSGLLIAAICGAYAVYLFRGGRFVIWFW